MSVVRANYVFGALLCLTLQAHAANLGETFPQPPVFAAEFSVVEAELNSAVAADPQDAFSWNRLGWLYFGEGDYYHAVRAFDVYLELVPDDYEAALTRARSLYYNGDNSDAVDAFYLLVNGIDIPDEVYGQALGGYAMALDRCGLADEACYFFEEGLSYTPGDIELRIAYATNLSGHKYFDAAFYQLSYILEEHPGHEAALIAIGRVYAWMGDYKEALCFLDQISCDGPYACEALLAKAYTHYYMGERQKSYELLRRYQGNCDAANPESCTLYVALTEVAEPTLGWYWSQWHDSDENNFTGNTVRLVVPLSAGGESLTIEHEHFKLHNSVLLQESTGTRTQLNWVKPLNDRLKVTTRVYYTDIDNGADPGQSRWNIAPSFDYKASQDWYVYGGYANYLVYDTTQLARSGVVLEDYTLGTRNRIGQQETWLRSEVSFGNYSDGNERVQWVWDAYRDHSYAGRGVLRSGVAAKTMDYRLDTNSGYFDPDEYGFGEIYLDWRDTSDNVLKADAAVALGQEKLTGQDSKSVLRYNFGLRVNEPGSPFAFNAGYYNSDAATTQGSGVGYQFNRWYFSATYSF